MGGSFCVYSAAARLVMGWGIDPLAGGWGTVDFLGEKMYNTKK